MSEILDWKLLRDLKSDENQREIDFLAKIEVKIGENLAFETKKLVFDLGFEGKKIFFVSDERIFDNCQKFFAASLKDLNVEYLIFENAKPDEENVEEITETSRNFDLIIALGSGVISDLCKIASDKNDIPYIIFPSAPSMNGYLSKNASIIVNDHRKTVGATLPLAVFCDLGILKTAPKSMIKAGIGDSMCFYGCWFDWLLSHLLLETEFNPECFAILSEKMGFFVENYQEFALEDKDFLKLLIEILLLSGASMTLAGGSFPASQSEHLIAHSYAMKYPQKEARVLHGLQIATTCLTTARIQEELLSQDSIEMREVNFEKEKMTQFFGAKIARECEKEYGLKAELIRKNRKFLQQELGQNWQDYCKVLSRIIFPEQNIRDIFKHFAIEAGFDALDLESGEYNEIIGAAKFIRNRFTCLDL